MARVQLSLLLLLIMWDILATAREYFPGSTERRLLHKLMRGYDKSVRPVLNSSSSVTVEFGLTLQRLIHLDNRNQVLHTSSWITMTWFDWRFQWVPLDFDNVTKLQIEVERIWTPDLMLYNKAESFSTTEFFNVNAVLFHDGRVFWMPPVLSMSTCPLNVFLFPFDLELCPLRFGSWAFDNSSLRLRLLAGSPDLSEMKDTGGEWAVLRVTNRVHSVRRRGDHRDEAVVSLCLRRRPIYYWLHILAPCVSLNALCLATFWQPPGETGKVALSVTAMLSHFVYVNLIAERLPNSHTVPIIGIYLFGSLFLSIFAVLLSIASSRLFHRSTTQEETVVCPPRPSMGLRPTSGGLLLAFLSSLLLSHVQASHHHSHRLRGLNLWVNRIAFALSALILALGYLLIIGMTAFVSRHEQNICDSLIGSQATGGEQ